MDPESRCRAQRAALRLFVLLSGILLAVPSARAAWVADGVPVSATGTSVRAARLTADALGGAYISYTRVAPDFGSVVDHLDADGVALSGWGPGAVEVPGLELLGSGSDGAGGIMLGWQTGSALIARRLDASALTPPGWTDVLYTYPSGPSYAAVRFEPDHAGGAWFVLFDVIYFCPDICQRSGYLRLHRVGTDGAVLPGEAILATEGDYSQAWTELTTTSGQVLTASGQFVAFPPALPAVLRRWASWSNPNPSPAITTQVPSGDDHVLRVFDDGAGGVLGVVQQTYAYSQPARLYHWNASGALPVGWPTSGVEFRTPAVPYLSMCFDSDGAGGVLAAWTEQGANGTEVRVQRLSGAGVPAVGWPAAGVVVCSGTGTRDGLTMVSDGNGGAFLSWADRRVDPDGDLFASHIRFDGTVAPGFQSNGSPVAISAGIKRSPRLVRLTSGDAMVAWEDLRAGTPRLYAQRIPVPGTLDVPAVPTGRLALSGFRPNPAQGVPHVAFTLPSAARVSLELFDLAGRSLHRTGSIQYPAGTHTMDMALERPLRAGVYLIRLRAGDEVRTVRGLIAP